MIPVTATSQRNVRECTAPFEFTDADGNLKTEDIRVRYFAQTLGELKKARGEAIAKFNAANKGKAKDEDFPWVSNKLAGMLESLPDLGGEDGKPFEITVENLDLISSVNLMAIDKAITDDLVPKSQPSI